MSLTTGILDTLRRITVGRMSAYLLESLAPSANRDASTTFSAKRWRGFVITYGFLTLDDQGIELDPADALYGDRLDKEFGHPRPMLDFDPHDHLRVSVQDAIYAEHGDLPHIYTSWQSDLAHGVRVPRFVGTDAQFERYAKAMRGCLDLPLELGLHNALLDLWEGWIVPDGERRIAAAEKRLRAALAYSASTWQDADLLAEVEAVCGEGRKDGRQVAFHCPLPSHSGEDRHPSLTVDPNKRTWFCWPCQKGGGVVAWRRTQGK